MEDEVPCRNDHEWEGVGLPKIDPDNLTEQYPSIVGVPCKCGKFVYNSRICGCSVEQRELWLQENNQYAG